MASRFTKRSIRGGVRGVLIEAALVVLFAGFAYLVSAVALIGP